MEYFGNLPIQFRWKLGLYDVEINGDKVKSATVMSQNCNSKSEKDFQAKCISEMKSRFSDNIPVVGVHIKQSRNYTTRDQCLLSLCVKDLCIITELDDGPFPEDLYKFFSDESVCFVGFNTGNYIVGAYDRVNVTARVVEIQQLAAAILKNKPRANYRRLADLGNAVGCSMEEEDEVEMEIPKLGNLQRKR